MNRFTTLAGVLTAVLVFAMLSTAVAGAHTWRVSEIGLSEHKREVKGAGTLEFSGSNIGTLRCKVSAKGKAGLGALSEVTAITGTAGEAAIHCELIKHSLFYCEGESEKYTVEAESLPWSGELQTVEGKLENVLLLGGRAWHVKCEDSKGGATSESCAASPRSLMANPTSGVEWLYNGTPRTTCAFTGQETFITTGSIIFSVASGEGRLEAV